VDRRSSKPTMIVVAIEAEGDTAPPPVPPRRRGEPWPHQGATRLLSLPQFRDPDGNRLEIIEAER